MKVEILSEKLSEDRNESFWYYGKEIARVQFPNGKKLYVESSGALELLVNNTRFVGENAVTEALNTNLTDKDIEEMTNDDSFSLMNWLSIVLVDENGETIDELSIEDDYDSALKTLEETKEEIFKGLYS